MLPLWGGALLYRLGSPHVPLLEFVSRGEFALYAASLMSAAFYVIVAEKETHPFPSQGFLVLVCVTLLIAAVLIFASTTVSHRVGIIYPTEKEVVLQWSASIYAASAVVAILVNLFNRVRPGLNISGMVAENQRQLEKKFEETR